MTIPVEPTVGEIDDLARMLYDRVMPMLGWVNEQVNWDAENEASKAPYLAMARETWTWFAEREK